MKLRGTGVTAPPITQATVGWALFHPTGPRGAPGGQGRGAEREVLLPRSAAPRGTLYSSCRPPSPAQPSPGVSRSPRGAMPTLLEKVHRYVWPKEREECPQVAFEQQPCKEIPITQWIIRRVRRLSFFHKKKEAPVGVKRLKPLTVYGKDRKKTNFHTYTGYPV
ncbi:uncharacterized protein LOC135114156 isoform X5 [Scylla paramamosain]|uniref:uncharacterized protein LOC135114156 isoform X5 n=1 Tax=Scylla paramamosain TaxID=85552 RepID=UPI003083D85E